VNNTHLYFLNAIRCGATGERFQSRQADIDYGELVHLASMHNSVPIFYVGLNGNTDGQVWPEVYLTHLKEISLANAVRQMVAYNALNVFLEACENAGIRAVVFKGIVLADLYKDYISRPSCDSDILIDPAGYNIVHKLLRESGYTFLAAESGEHVKCYKSKNLSIDLHLRLWGDSVGRHIGAVEKHRLDDMEKTINLRVRQLNITTLDYQAHFIYLLVHIAKHFIIKGVGVRQLMDVSLFYDRYRDNIDLPALWALIDDMGFLSVVRYIFKICERHLGMDASIFMGEDPVIDNDVLNALIKDIIEGGAFGTTPERSVSHNVVKESYYAGLKNKNQGALVWHLIFPRAVALPKKYKYVRKYPILLPIAWAHRILNFIRNRLVRKDHIKMFSAINQSSERIRLLEDLDLVK